MKLMIVMMLITVIGSLQAIELTYDKVRNNLRGIKSYEKEDIDTAVEHFERNVINNPGEGNLHFNLGNSYYRKGDFDSAMNEYHRALRDDNFTGQSATFHNLGNAFFEQQQYKEALDMYRNAIITNPNNSDARYNYELTRLMLQEMSEQEEPQSGQSDSEQQEEQPAEETDEQDGDDAEGVKKEKGEGVDEQKESDIDKQKELENAENTLRTLLSRERELMEEERERNRKELNLRGRFW